MLLNAASLGDIGLTCSSKGGLKDESMPVEDVWAALTEEKWQSFRALRNISGLDEDSLTRVVNFLVRWNFAESCRLRELHIRRKPGTISPPEIVALLHTLTQDRRVKTLSGQVGILAERVACRICGGQAFIPLGGNQVECSHCGERQWYAIDKLKIRNYSSSCNM